MIELYDTVSSMQNEKRYKHTLGVIDMAKRLAAVYNVDMLQVETAALLHDVTKQAPKELQENLLRQVDDQFIIDNPPLWHSFTGSIYAEQELGIKDEQILESIKYHTTGKKDCSSLAKIIYLSDYLEEGRSYEPIQAFRNKIGIVSLDNLYNQVARSRISYELEVGHQLHPLTKELYESII